MKDKNRSKEELINELIQLRKRNTELEQANKRTEELELITNCKRTENALIEREEKLKTILENTSDGINMLDLRTGKYLYMSPSQVEMSGFTKEEINNISTDELYERMHPNDLVLSIKQNKLMAIGIESFENVEYRWKVKNGEYRWFSDRRKVIQDENGQPIALVGISRDITDRKEYEEKLALQAKILSNVNDGIIVVDENDKIIYCNKAFVKLFGWQEQELIGCLFFYFVHRYIDEESKEKFLCKLEEMKKSYSTVEEDH